MHPAAIMYARQRRATELGEGQRPTSRVVSLQLPLGGWNLRDSPQNMPRDDARLMDNCYPENGVIKAAITHTVTTGGSMSVDASGSYINIYGVNPGTGIRFLLTT